MRVRHADRAGEPLLRCGIVRKAEGAGGAVHGSDHRSLRADTIAVHVGGIIPVGIVVRRIRFFIPGVIIVCHQLQIPAAA